MSKVIEEYERLERIPSLKSECQVQSENVDLLLHGAPDQEVSKPSTPPDIANPIWDQAKSKLTSAEVQYLKDTLGEHIATNALLHEEIKTLKQITEEIHCRISNTPKLPTAPDRQFIQTQVKWHAEKLKGSASLDFLGTNEQYVLKWCCTEQCERPRSMSSNGSSRV